MTSPINKQSEATKRAFEFEKMVQLAAAAPDTTPAADYGEYDTPEQEERAMMGALVWPLAGFGVAIVLGTICALQFVR